MKPKSTLLVKPKKFIFWSSTQSNFCWIPIYKDVYLYKILHLAQKWLTNILGKVTSNLIDSVYFLGKKLEILQIMVIKQVNINNQIPKEVMIKSRGRKRRSK